MAADQIRLGIIGANIHLGWAPRSHLPAVVASPEFELTALPYNVVRGALLTLNVNRL